MKHLSIDALMWDKLLTLNIMNEPIFGNFVNENKPTYANNDGSLSLVFNYYCCHESRPFPNEMYTSKYYFVSIRHNSWTNPNAGPGGDNKETYCNLNFTKYFDTIDKIKKEELYIQFRANDYGEQLFLEVRVLDFDNLLITYDWAYPDRKGLVLRRIQNEKSTTTNPSNTTAQTNTAIPSDTSTQTDATTSSVASDLVYTTYQMHQMRIVDPTASPDQIPTDPMDITDNRKN